MDPEYRKLQRRIARRKEKVQRMMEEGKVRLDALDCRLTWGRTYG